MARTPIIIDPPANHDRPPTIPGLPDDEFPAEDERPTGPGIKNFFQEGPAVATSESTPVSVEVQDTEDDWEDFPPPRDTGIPDWAPVAAMCLCAVVGVWAVVDRLFA